MFDNIGRKIKVLAQAVCWVGIVLSIIIGLVVIVSAIASDTLIGFLYGFIIMIVGSLASWVSSFFAYGFGELIEKTTEIAYNTEKEQKPIGPSRPYEPTSAYYANENQDTKKTSNQNDFYRF